MKHGFPYKSDRKYFVFQAIFLFSFILLISLYHFHPAFGTTSKLFLYLMILSLWGYSEYHHRVKMSLLTFDYGKLCGKIELLEEFKKNRRQKRKK